jgi:hypothetical protein
MATKDFDIGFSPEALSGLTPEDGTGYKRVQFGDFTFKITDGEIIASKNAKKPHNMLKITFTVVKAYDEANTGEVGNEITGLYGTPSSPPFMQKRFKALCEAVKAKAGPGGLKFSALHGKTFDGSVVWELSDSGKLDEMGRKKFYVNDRVKAERPVGTPRPKNINPAIDSKAAQAYLNNDSGGDSPAEGGDTAPWEAPVGEAAGAVNDDSDPDNDGAVPSYIPEDEVPADAHEYRAVIKLGGDEADSARQALIDAGVDPEGPVNVEHLTAATKKAWDAKFNPKPGKPGLKPLAGGKK